MRMFQIRWWTARKPPVAGNNDLQHCFAVIEFEICEYLAVPNHLAVFEYREKLDLLNLTTQETVENY